MPVALSEQTMAVVKATAPALQQHGIAITRRMYERLFWNEDVKALFNEAEQASGEQPRRLAAAIIGYAQNVDKLHNMSGSIRSMAERHFARGVRPEHYPYVARALLAAIRDILGEAATDEVIQAWTEAYWFLAEILIGEEARLYAKAAAA